MPNIIIQPSIPTIYKKILKDGVSGELIVHGDGCEKHLFFIDGDLVAAKTSVPEERLGNILYRMGKISLELWQDIPELISRKHEKLGKLLVQYNIIDQRALYGALKEQIRTIAVSLFTISQGEWDFIRQVPDLAEDARLKIRLPEIVVAGMAYVESISFFENQFYYQTPKTGLIPQPISKCLSDEEIGFYKELSVYSQLSSDKIIEAMGISEVKFWKKINLFYLLNILDFDESSGTQEDTKVAIDAWMVEIIEEIMMRYQDIKAQKSDYYQLLGVTREARPVEIRDAYNGLLHRFQPGDIKASPQIMEKIQFVLEEIGKAFETLISDEKRRGYNGTGEEKPGPQPKQSKEDKREEARKLFSRGKALFTEKRFMEASLALEKAVDLDDRKAAYYLLLGRAQSEIPMLHRKAEESLKKTAEMEPWNPEPLYALGLLFRAEDLPMRAEVFFRKAMEVDVDHTLAGKLLHTEDKEESAKKKSFLSILGKK